MRKSRISILVGTAAVAAAIVSGGTALTAANTQSASQVVGYGTTSISGATVSSLAYALGADGSNVDSVALVLANDTTASAVSIGFNGGATTSCGTGTYDAVAVETAYVCNNDGVSFVQSTSDLTSTAVVVN